MAQKTTDLSQNAKIMLLNAIVLNSLEVNKGGCKPWHSNLLAVGISGLNESEAVWECKRCNG